MFTAKPQNFAMTLRAALFVVLQIATVPLTAILLLAMAVCELRFRFSAAGRGVPSPPRSQWGMYANAENAGRKQRANHA